MRQGFWFGLLVGFIWIWLVLWVDLGDTAVLGNIRVQDNDTYHVFAWVLFGSGLLAMMVGGIRGSIVRRSFWTGMVIALWSGVFGGIIAVFTTLILHFSAMDLLSFAGSVVDTVSRHRELTPRQVVIHDAWVFSLRYFAVSVGGSIPSGAFGAWFGKFLRPMSHGAAHVK